MATRFPPTAASKHVSPFSFHLDYSMMFRLFLAHIMLVHERRLLIFTFS